MVLNFSQTNFKPIAESWDEEEVELQTNHKVKNKSCADLPSLGLSGYEGHWLACICLVSIFNCF